MTRKTSKREKGITLIALIVTIIVHLVPYDKNKKIIVHLVPYDKNKKYSNLVGFSL